MDPAAVHGEARVALEVGCIEAFKPSFERRGSTAAGERKRERRDDHCDPIRVRGRVRVLERRLELAPRLVPIRRAAVESRNELGFLLRQLPNEQVTEQAVEAEPAAPAFERYEEEIRARDLLELEPGVFGRSEE